MTIQRQKPAILADIDFQGAANGWAIGASAGTGKTYTLEHLVLDRVLAGVGIEEILVVTFTRRATAEMKGRVRGMLERVLDRGLAPEAAGEADGPAWTIGEVEIERVRRALDRFDEASISTIHAFCQQVLSDHAFSSRQLFDAELVDASELFTDCFYDVLRDTLAARQPERSWLRWALEVYGDLEELAGHLRTIHARGAQVVPDWEALGVERRPAPPTGGDDDYEAWQVCTACWHLFGEAVADRMAERKRRDGLMTYDDLLDGVHAHKSDGLGDILGERYRVVLVDEFQDTDPVQWEILREVFLEGGRDVVVIGDEKQSIYGFRGADVETYRRALAAGGLDGPHSLSRNYRSTDALIDAYNRLFAAGFFDGEAQPDYAPVDPPRGGGVERELCGAIGSEPLEVMQLAVAEDEEISSGQARSIFVERTAERIEDLLGDETYRFADVETERRRPLQPGDIYVLTRTNAEADRVGEALAARGIPHAFYRKPGLFETDEALEVIRLLRAIARPDDRSRRRRAMLTPFFAIRLDELMAYERGEADFTPRKRLEAWQRTARGRNFTELFDDIMRGSGVVRRELLARSSERRLTNYRQIFDWLLQQAAGSHLGVEELADRLYRFREGYESDGEEEGSDLQRLETDRSSVQIMTIHKCKGLSAEVVFVCGGFSMRDDCNYHRDLKVFKPSEADRPRAFHRKTLEDHGPSQSAYAEEFARYVRQEVERLYYVAITRARAKVYLPFVAEDDHDWRVDRSEVKILFDALAGSEGHVIDAGLEGLEVDRFERSEVDTEPVLPEVVASAEQLERVEDLGAIAGVHPPEAIEGVGFDEMREGRGRFNESYSSLADHATDRGGQVPQTHDEPLPQGIDAGNFIHGVLEHLDYTTAEGVADAQAWLGQTGPQRGANKDETTVREWLVGWLEACNFDEKYVDYTAERLVGALQAPLKADGEDLPPLSAIDDGRTAREVGFTLPLSSEVEWALGAWPEGGSVDKGYFNGEIDLLFDDASGRIYFADWKSDTRVGPARNYERQTLEAHVQGEYRAQALVYTTALVRMLGITDEASYQERFGGFFYLFVRGMDAAGERGQYFQRVGWEEIEQLGSLLAEQSPDRAVEAWGES